MEHPLEHLTACPSCASQASVPFLKCTDFTVSKEPFSIVECRVCGLRYTNSRPSEQHIGPYYESPEYVSHSDTSSGLLYSLYQAVKKRALRQKAKLLASISNGRTLLDYGAGTGDFANTMSTAGWNIKAFEPSPQARERIASKYPAIGLVNSLIEVPTSSIDTVTLWHVLEHVHRLDETLNHFSRMLKPDGTLLIAVPNCSSYDARYYSNHWAAYDVPRHLYHFQPHTITTLLNRHGFKLTATKPMWFDSYYVSLLSESYRNPNANLPMKLFGWVRAFIIGSISNAKTLTSTEQCSSVIYILKKA